MGKKKAFSKGLKNVALKKSPFKVADAQHKKKPKAVKTKIKQIQAKVRAQQESSDKNLKALHEQLVVKKPVAKSEKAKLPQKKVKKAAPSTSKVQDDLKKMNVD